MIDYKYIFSEAEKLGISQIEVTHKNSFSSRIDTANLKVDGTKISDIESINIRGIYNSKMGYLYSEAFSKENIPTLLQDLISSAQSNTSNEQEFILDNSGLEYQNVNQQSYTSFDIPISEKLEKLLEVESKLKVSDLITRTETTYAEYKTDKRIINSNGMDLTFSSSYNLLYTSIVAKKNDVAKDGYSSDISFDFFDFDIEKIVKETTEDALKSLEAVTPETNNLEVVFKNDVVCSLLGSVSSIFSAESLIRKSTKLVDKEEVKVFGENINILDDPFYHTNVAKRNFDDEGFPTSTKTLVERGVFKGFLHNLKTAKIYDTVSTGNGYSNGSNISVSVRNLVLVPGNTTFDNLINSVKDGIYITSLEGMHAGLNVISGDFSLQATGFRIKDGVISEALTLFMINSNIYELLNNVIEIGNDILPKTFGTNAPSIKVSNISISGK